MRRGEIRWFQFAHPDKRRPVLLLGPFEDLGRLSQITVIPLSTQARGLDWEVPLGFEDGLPSECVLKPEWIRSVERSLIGGCIGALPIHRWDEVRRALLLSMGFTQLRS
jgi:mRNA interferase MazF